MKLTLSTHCCTQSFRNVFLSILARLWKLNSAIYLVLPGASKKIKRLILPQTTKLLQPTRVNDYIYPWSLRLKRGILPKFWKLKWLWEVSTHTSQACRASSWVQQIYTCQPGWSAKSASYFYWNLGVRLKWNYMTSGGNEFQERPYSKIQDTVLQFLSGKAFIIWKWVEPISKGDWGHRFIDSQAVIGEHFECLQF